MISWGFGVPCRTRTCFSALCYATCCPCTIGTISRDCGLSVVTRGEFTQRFRLSQAYVYIIPRFLAPKLAKFQNKKVGRSHDQLSNLRSQLLVAHDTYKPILARQLRSEVQELRADAVDCALVHSILLARHDCCVTVVVVPHCPSFI